MGAVGESGTTSTTNEDKSAVEPGVLVTGEVDRHLAPAAAGIPPPGWSGAGASLVHRITAVGSGSPEATPSVKGSDFRPGSRGAGSRGTPLRAAVVVVVEPVVVVRRANQVVGGSVDGVGPRGVTVVAAESSPPLQALASTPMPPTMRALRDSSSSATSHRW